MTKLKTYSHEISFTPQLHYRGLSTR